MRVAGVDGCRGGWVVAIAEADATGAISAIDVRVVGAGVSPFGNDVARTAIDIPIGLPPVGGQRAADRAARRLLGRRGVCVFPAPPRDAFALTGFDDPRRSPLGLTLESWAIVRKIRQIDCLIEPGLQFGDARTDGAVLEAHPEILFHDLAGGPVLEPKRSPLGRGRRLRLLAGAFGARFTVPAVPAGAAADDVLDALACLWLAAAPAAELFALPESPRPERDGRGLRMEIWRRRWPVPPGIASPGPGA